MFQVSPFSKFRLQSSIVPQLLAAVAVLGLSASAHANIVTDGGFESAGGGATYQAALPSDPVTSIDGGSWDVILGSVYIDSSDPYVYDGSNSLNLGGANANLPNTISQVLSTVVGDTYTVSFYGNSDSPNSFSMTENGAAVTNAPGSIADNGFPDQTAATDPNALEFVDYTGTFVATSDSTTLDLTATGDAAPFSQTQTGSVLIDDVNVAVAPTPEPGSIVLMLTGVAGLGLLAAKKRLFGAAMVG